MTHHPINSGLRAATLSVAAMALVVIGSAAGAAASSGPHPVPPVEVDRAAGSAGGEEVGADPQTPTWLQTREHRRLCVLAAAMPSDWPATMASRRQAEQPLGDAGERDRWRRDAALLPSYWPAAQAMAAAADERLGCSFWIGE